MERVLFARQPIFDADLNVSAYELLYRPDLNATTSQVEEKPEDFGDKATATVLLNFFTEIDLDSIIGNKKAFINFTEHLLFSDFYKLFPNDRIVIEVLEGVELNERCVVRLKELSRAGYEIALDDFVFREEAKAAMEIADYIKFDVMTTPEEEIAKLVAVTQGCKAKLLAEKVEAHSMYQVCQKNGFVFFQGYFFEKPENITVKKEASGSVSTLTLLSKLQDPAVEIEEIELLLAQDVTLTHKILRLINSAAVPISRSITSLREAILFLGLAQLRSLASVVALASMGQGKPNELMRATILRAQMCAQIAERLGEDKIEEFFTVGLFSMLDALLDESMSNILRRLPLDTRLNKALLAYDGRLGEVLRYAMAYERGDWETLSEATPAIDWQEAYYESVKWADALYSSVK